MEDVIEELIQEEIVDETDVFVDVHRRILVARARLMQSQSVVCEDDIRRIRERGSQRFGRRARSTGQVQRIQRMTLPVRQLSMCIVMQLLSVYTL